MSKTLYVSTLFVLLQVVVGYAQQITMNGKVTDSLSNPLSYANIIARPQEQKVSMAFAIADQQGHYQLNLKSNTAL